MKLFLLCSLVICGLSFPLAIIFGFNNENSRINFWDKYSCSKENFDINKKIHLALEKETVYGYFDEKKINTYIIKQIFT